MAEVLERGNIYFVFRPKVEHTSAEGLKDIQRFFLILSPYGEQRYRLIVIGRKKLPTKTSLRIVVYASTRNGKQSTRPNFSTSVRQRYERTSRRFANTEGRPFDAAQGGPPAEPPIVGIGTRREFAQHFADARGNSVCVRRRHDGPGH